MHTYIRTLFALLVFVSLAVPVSAQVTVVTGNKFAWDQAAPDLATVTSYVYRYYPDGSATGIIVGATCVAGSTPTLFTCSFPVPAFVPGPHTLELTAANQAGESSKSAAFPFNVVVVPVAPANIRIAL